MKGKRFLFLLFFLAFFFCKASWLFCTSRIRRILQSDTGRIEALHSPGCIRIMGRVRPPLQARGCWSHPLRALGKLTSQHRSPLPPPPPRNNKKNNAYSSRHTSRKMIRWLQIASQGERVEMALQCLGPQQLQARRGTSRIEVARNWEVLIQQAGCCTGRPEANTHIW